MLKRAALVNMCVFACMNFPETVNAGDSDDDSDRGRSFWATRAEKKLAKAAKQAKKL